MSMIDVSGSTPYATMLKSRPEKLIFMPCVRWPPWSSERPSSVSPGRAIACSTAAFAVAPECGWTFANVGAEQRLRPLDRELLGDVDLFAAAVVAATGVALGVLVGQHRALRLQHRDGHEVLGRDHLEIPALALEFALEHLRDLGVDLGERRVEVLVGHGVLLDDGVRAADTPRDRACRRNTHRPRRTVECRVGRSPVVTHLNASRDIPSITDAAARRERLRLVGWTTVFVRTPYMNLAVDVDRVAPSPLLAGCAPAAQNGATVSAPRRRPRPASIEAAAAPFRSTTPRDHRRCGCRSRAVAL